LSNNPTAEILYPTLITLASQQICYILQSLSVGGQIFDALAGCPIDPAHVAGVNGNLAEERAQQRWVLVCNNLHGRIAGVKGQEFWADPLLLVAGEPTASRQAIVLLRK